MVIMRKTGLDDDDSDSFDSAGVCKPGRSLHVPVGIMDSRRFTRLTDEQARAYQPGFRGRDAGSQPDPAATEYELSKSRLSNAWRGQSGTPYQAAPDLFALAEKLAPLLGLAKPIRASSAPLDPALVARNYGRQSDGADDRRAAYGEMVKKLGDAWRTPVGRDGVVIDPDEGNDLLRAIEEAIAQELEGRDRATDPAKAVKIERQQERWLGRPIEELQREVEVKRRKQNAENVTRLSNAWRGA